MKKIISIFLLIASFLSFYIAYNNEKMEYSKQIEEIQLNLPNSYNIIIPTKVDNQDRKKSYENIVKILDKYNASLYYNRLSKDNETGIKYIYDKNTKYVSQISIKSGDTLTSETMNTNKFISTRKNIVQNQIGIIANFNKDVNIDIKTFKSMLDDGFSFSGSCYISFENSVNITSFINELESAINVKGITVLEKQDINITLENNYIWIIVVIYFIVMLLILYDLLNSYKKIGIKKLLGFSSRKIYYESVLTLIKINLLVGLISTVVMSVIFFNQLNIYIYKFLFKFSGYILIETALLILICSLAYLYINFINITTMLKNKKPLMAIIILNYFAKLVCLIALTFFIVQGVNNIEKIKGVFSKSFENWEVLDNFATISTSNITDLNNTDEYLNTQKELYKDFNEKGAIFARFSEYSPGIRAVRIAETKYYYEQDNVFVNPNYLKNYKIYDENNNPISISEEDKDFIILVPEQYKSDEKEFMKYFEFWKETTFYSTGKDQKTKIIWTKSNQNIFTASVDINPTEGNTIVDPLIHVLTENNATLNDYDTILAIEGGPFKIKADPGKQPENTIIEEFNKYSIGNYVGNISRVNEQVASEAKNVKDNLKSLIIFGSILLIIVSILIIQNAYNYFDKYSQNLAIKKLCGYKIIDKHLNYLIGIVICWNIVFCLSIIIYKASLIQIALIAIVGLGIEMIFSLIVLAFIEKRKIIKSLKGA